MAKAYTEDTILTLDALEHIRLRSGMYIGRLGDGSHPDDGIYILLKEVIDNGVDEFIMGYGKKIEIDSKNGNTITVRDYGRGIPLGKLIECASKINTGAKYNNDVFQFSTGLNGVGIKAVNALSSYFCLESIRDGKWKRATFEQGRLIREEDGKTKEPNGTKVVFTPDATIFKKFRFDDEIIYRRIWNYAYLNLGLTLVFNGEAISSPNGLLDLLNREVPKGEELYPPFHVRKERMECAFLHTEGLSENYFSFVNGQHTQDGGTHLSAFREGLLKAVNEFSKKNFQGSDVREGIIGAISIRLQDPIFESQTKNKLSNPDIRADLVRDIKDALLEQFYKAPDAAKLLLEKVVFNEQLKKELSLVKKEARERQKKISFKIPKLRDSRYHRHDKDPYGEESSLFITEGDSASASLVSARNPLTQAVFSLRGKPLNVYGMKKELLYKNEEMYYLMCALDIEEDLDRLRYNRIILATDADVDGMHIRNLLITFFLTYFEGLVVNGHLFILETPLFKVRIKDKTSYCYSEQEKNKIVEKSKEKTEVTRFKGLGEISPGEFKQFIGNDIRLVPVALQTLADVAPTLRFYMGKNTPERKLFIMNNLIQDL